MKSYKAVGLITIAIIISIIIMMPPAFSGEDKIPTPKSPVLRLRTLVKGTHISNAASIRTASSVISSSDPCNICSGADCSQKQNAMGAMISMGTEGEEPVPEANFGFGSYTLIYGNIFGFHGGAAVADWGGPVQTQMTAGSYICMPAVGAFEKSAGFSEPICPGPAGSSCPAWAPVYMEYIASPPQQNLLSERDLILLSNYFELKDPRTTILRGSLFYNFSKSSYNFDTRNVSIISLTCGKKKFFSFPARTQRKLR